MTTYLSANGAILSTSNATNGWPRGTSAAETQNGSIYNDLFQGSGGDLLVGGQGDDTYNLWDAKETVSELAGQGVDTIVNYSWCAVTLPSNVENLFLQCDGATAGTGNSLANIIGAGSVGATLNGMGGDDVLIGGAGADIFKVAAGNGSDAIVNFTPSSDIIQLQGYGITSFDQLKGLGAQVGSDVRFSFGNGEALVLRNVSLSDLSAYDFGLKPTPAPLDPGYVAQSGSGKCYSGGGWYVLNNTWGSTGLTGYTIDSAYNPADLTNHTTFNWSYPATTQYAAPILAYPEVGFGPSPQSGGIKVTDVGDVFPVKVGELTSFTADYNVALQGNKDGCDVSFDMWLTSTPGGGASTITNEVMVWLHKGDVTPYGSLVGTTTIDGVSAHIYVSHGQWTYTAVILDTDHMSGQLDVADLLHKLQGMGIVSSDEYFASLELGAEVVSGGGSLSVNNLDLNVTTAAADGTSKIMSVTGAGSASTLYGADGGVLGETLAGGGGADSFIGTTGNDVLVGGLGNDVLDGGAGGVDTAEYAEKTSALTITLADSGDSIAYVKGVAEDTLRNIQNLTGGSAADALTGNAKDNLLIGGAGDDVLIGGGGYDTLDGGAGNDTADYSAKTLSVTATLNGASDVTVYVGGVAEDTLRNIERLKGGSAADTLTGDANGNYLYGNNGNDILVSGDGNDGLWGGSGADTHDGGAGADTLCGGAGADLLTGGAGADVFRYAATSESTSTTMDRITDFTGGEDILDLAGIDANTLVTGDQAFTVVTAYSNVAGQLILTASGADTIVSGDVNGDGISDFAVRLTGTVSSTTGWLL